MGEAVGVTSEELSDSEHFVVFTLFFSSSLFYTGERNRRTAAAAQDLLRSIKIRGEENMGSGSFLKVLLNNFDVLAGPLVTLVYPLYASVRAIETKSRIDDQQWLTYWVLYSMITLFELTFAKVIECLPFWSYLKLGATCWLVLPYFSGAAYVYERFVRPMFVNPQTINIWYVPRANKKEVFSKPDDVLTAAERYIEEHGSQAFEKLISRADKEARSKRSSNHMIFDEGYKYNSARATNSFHQASEAKHFTWD